MDGAFDGFDDGPGLGFADGILDGFELAAVVGSFVGKSPEFNGKSFEGLVVGENDRIIVGLLLCANDGCKVWPCCGSMLGIGVNSVEGKNVGSVPFCPRTKR